MRAPINVEVRYTHHCLYCNASEVEMHYLPRGAEFPLPAVPRGWQDLNGLPVCPKHELTARERTTDELRCL